MLGSEAVNNIHHHINTDGGAQQQGREQQCELPNERQLTLTAAPAVILSYKVTVKLGRPAVSELSCFTCFSAVGRLWSLPLSANSLLSPPSETYSTSFNFFYYHHDPPQNKTEINKKISNYINHPFLGRNRPTPTSVLSSPSTSSSNRRLSTTTTSSDAVPAPPTSYTLIPSSLRKQSRTEVTSPPSDRSSNDTKSYLKPTVASLLKAPSRSKRSSLTTPATFRY